MKEAYSWVDKLEEWVKSYSSLVQERQREVHALEDHLRHLEEPSAGEKLPLGTSLADEKSRAEARSMAYTKRQVERANVALGIEDARARLAAQVDVRDSPEFKEVVRLAGKHVARLALESYLAQVPEKSLAGRVAGVLAHMDSQEVEGFLALAREAGDDEAMHEIAKQAPGRLEVLQKRGGAVYASEDEARLAIGIRQDMRARAADAIARHQRAKARYSALLSQISSFMKPDEVGSFADRFGLDQRAAYEALKERGRL